MILPVLPGEHREREHAMIPVTGATIRSAVRLPGVCRP